MEKVNSAPLDFLLREKQSTNEKGSILVFWHSSRKVISNMGILEVSDSSSQENIQK